MGSHVTAVRYLSYPIWVRRHVGSALKPATVMLVDHIVGRPHVLGADGSKLASRYIPEMSHRRSYIQRNSAGNRHRPCAAHNRACPEEVTWQRCQKCACEGCGCRFLQPGAIVRKDELHPVHAADLHSFQNPSSSIGSPGWQCRLPAPGAALPN